MDKVELIHFADDLALARAAAVAWLQLIAARRGTGNLHCVALSGGRIAKPFFSAVTDQAKAGEGLPSSVHFFWADERCVPPENVESNFCVASELLLEPLQIAKTNIHRIHGENTPESAASAAEIELRRFATSDAAGLPVLDLVFLGMGEDGHVASLFPGEAEALCADMAVYRAVRRAPKPPPRRITLGYAAIATARQVWVLISGAGKETALRESLRPDGKTPLARVLQSRSHTRIFSDNPFI